MPFTPVATFVTATDISATDINNNNKELREFINTGIVAADIEADSVESPEIVRGEYYQVVRDHQFTSGDIYSQYKSGETFNLSYLTGQLKNTYDLSDIRQYNIVPNTGKRFYLEDNAVVFYHCCAEIITPADQLNANDVGEFSWIGISVDGTIVSDTLGHSFTETGSHTVVTGCSNSQANRRWYGGVQAFYLTAGWHEVGIAVDVNTSHALVAARSAYIETFYKTTF